MNLCNCKGKGMFMNCCDVLLGIIVFVLFGSFLGIGVIVVEFEIICSEVEWCVMLMFL